MDALTYFASSPTILEEAGDELDVVLKRIHDDKLMSPLQVIQALSNNSVVTMGRVKKYLSDNIERERKEISTVSLHLAISYSVLANLCLESPLDIQLQLGNREEKARNRATGY